MKSPKVLVVLLIAGLTLIACAAGPNVVVHSPDAQVAGFWLGLWHGFISPITFLISLFNHNVNIYEVVNNGSWYNFGFMIGVSAFFSGGPTAATRSGRRSRAER